MKKVGQFILAIIICQAAGGIGSLFTYPQIESWYQGIAKSNLNPPNSIFGPVWITLFTLMGIALYWIWQKKDNKNFKMGLIFFIIQLVLNSLWSIIFFGLQNPLLALIEMAFLWLFILLSIIYFYKIDKKAGYILIPYIFWVSFAFYLNFEVFRLN